MIRRLIYKFFVWKEKDPLRARILFFVLLSHIAACTYGLSGHDFVLQKKHNLIVATKYISPIRPKNFVMQNKNSNFGSAKVKNSTGHKSSTTPQEVVKNNQKKVEKETSKKTGKTTSKKNGKAKKIIDKTTTNKATKKKPSPPQKINKDLAEEIENSIQVLDESFAKSKHTTNHAQTNSLPILKPLDNLQIDIAGDQFELESQGEASYGEILIQYLQESLHLPEFGEVVVRLSMFPDGKISALSVISAKSEKNKRYLEKTLPSLKLPNMGIIPSKDNVFIITFSNKDE